jgi:NAD(P)-dependent dehydrogenase (short-subunit alcohol dehydrogenase family)
VTALVTGSARGLGFAFCAALAARGETVLAACRRPTAQLEQLGVRVVPGVDVGSDDCVPVVEQAVAGEHVDLVIAAAGINEPTDDLAAVDTATMLREYDVNALGALRVVRAALPRMGEGGKIALVSTGSGSSFSQTTPRPDNYGYRMSKAALNVFGAILAVELEPRGIGVIVVGPGLTDTDMSRRAAALGNLTRPLSEMLSAAEVAELLLSRIDELTPATSGQWVGRDGTRYL